MGAASPVLSPSITLMLTGQAETRMIPYSLPQAPLSALLVLANLFPLQGFHPNNVGHGQSQGNASPHGAAPANGQPLAPTAKFPRPSEFLRTLARDYILDPRTSIGEIRMKPSGNGLMEMTITLKAEGTV